METTAGFFTSFDSCWEMNFPLPSTGSLVKPFSTSKALSTFAGDIIGVQDLVVGTAAGPALRDGQAQAAAAAIVNPTDVGA